VKSQVLDSDTGSLRACKEERHHLIQDHDIVILVLIISQQNRQHVTSLLCLLRVSLLQLPSAVNNDLEHVSEGLAACNSVAFTRGEEPFSKRWEKDRVGVDHPINQSFKSSA